MKKILLIILCGTLVFAFGACSKVEVKTPVPDESTTEEAVGTGVPNPMVEVTEPNFDDKLGFSINGWPADYSYDHIYMIAGAVSEIDFKVNGNALSFRVAKEAEGDISGVYDPFNQNETKDISGVKVTIAYTQDQTGLATWTKDGYVFSLYIKSGASTENLSQIAEKIINNISIGSFKAS